MFAPCTTNHTASHRNSPRCAILFLLYKDDDALLRITSRRKVELARIVKCNICCQMASVILQISRSYLLVENKDG